MYVPAFSMRSYEIQVRRPSVLKELSYTFFPSPIRHLATLYNIVIQIHFLMLNTSRTAAMVLPEELQEKETVLPTIPTPLMTSA